MRVHGVRVRVLVAGVAMIGFLVSCGDDDPTGPDVSLVDDVVEVSGGDQTGVVGAPLGQPLVVEVLDDDGDPMEGGIVIFAVTSGGGTMTNNVVVSDDDGIARDFWTLGTSTGLAQTVEVRSVDSQGNQVTHVTFSATPTPGAVASVTLQRDTLAFGWIGDTIHARAQARDQFGNEVTGAPIRFRVDGGEGVVAVDSVTGVYSALQAGSQRIRAVLGAVADTARAVVVPLIADIVPAPDSIVAASLQDTLMLQASAADSGGSVVASSGLLRWHSLDPTIIAVRDSINGAVFTLAPGLGRVEVSAVNSSVRDTVRINVSQVVTGVTVSPPARVLPAGDSAQLTGFARDANGVAVAGIAVTWSSLDATIASVSATGMVSAHANGVTQIIASAGAMTGIANITVRDADVLSISPAGGNGQAGVVGQDLPGVLQAVVTNQFGEVIPGVAVSWGSDMGISIAQASVTTDEAGINSVGIALDTVAGIQRAYATIGNDTATFSFIAHPDVAATFALASELLQADTVGDTVPSNPRVRVTDRFGNGVPGLVVQFTAHGGSIVTGAAPVTTADGYASVSAWQLDTIPGGDTLVAALADTLDTGFAALTFGATVVPDSASTVRSILSVADTVRESGSVPILVQLIDRYGNPLTASDGTVGVHTTLGSIMALTDNADGTWSGVLVPNGARGLASVHATLDGDSVATPRTVVSRSYRLTWLGGSTDYYAPSNWSAPGGPPSPNDSIYIPAGLGNYPTITQNQSIEDVFIETGATINISSFDFTVARNMSAIGTGLTGTGRLLMTGIGVLSGNSYRNLRILDGGRVSLEANLDVTGGRIVVQGGRLRSTGFRIRVRPN